MKTLIFSLIVASYWNSTISAHQDPPKQIRIQTQWIEMSHSQFTELLGNQSSNKKQLYQATHQLLTKQKAKIIHSTLLLTRSGARSTAESIQEFIYPAEHHFSSMPIPNSLPDNASVDLSWYPPTLRPQGSCPVAFETRNIGCTLQIEPSTDSEQTIDLRLAPEWVEMPSMVNWVSHQDQWGRADIKFPLFYSMKSTSALTVTNDQYSLVNVTSPVGLDGKANLSKKVLLFVKATFMPPEVSH